MANDMIGAAKDLLLRESGPGPATRKMVEEKVRTDPVTNAIFESAARTIVNFVPFDMTPFVDQYAGPGDLQAWAKSIMRRAPDFTIGGDYMQRWFIIPRNDRMNLYLHRTLRSDDDVMHDHPWDNMSFVIDGGYTEHTPNSVIDRKPGDVVSRKADDVHRLQLWHGRPSVSLFMTGPKVREWGFHCPKGWVHWKDFTGGYHEGRSDKGAGCGEYA